MKLSEKIFRLREKFGLEAADSSELQKGIDIESEHKDTIDWIKKYYKDNGKFPPDEEVFTKIATDHLDEFKDYYTRLKAMEQQAKKSESFQEASSGQALDELHGEVNDVYTEYDEGRINLGQAVQKMKKACNAFLRDAR